MICFTEAVGDYRDMYATAKSEAGCMLKGT